jgi:hypothetical protein
MSKYTKKQKVAVALGAGAIAIAGGGVALAYWSASDTGTGTATTTAATNADLSFTNTAISGMAPGVDPAALAVTVKNNNAHSSAQVNTLTAYLTVAKDPSATGTCDATDYTLDGHTDASSANPVTLGWTTATVIPASGTDTTDGTDKLGFNDKPSSNQDGCKGAMVTLNYATS